MPLIQVSEKTGEKLNMARAIYITLKPTAKRITNNELIDHITTEYLKKHKSMGGM